MISDCFLMLFCLACKSVPENCHICGNKGFAYLLSVTHGDSNNLQLKMGKNMYHLTKKQIIPKFLVMLSVYPPFP